MLVIGIVVALVALVNLASYLRSPDFSLRRWTRKGRRQLYVGFAHAEAAGVRIRTVDYMIEGRARRIVAANQLATPLLIAVTALVAFAADAPGWVGTTVLSVLLLGQLGPVRALAQAVHQIAVPADGTRRFYSLRAVTNVLVGIGALVVGTASVWAAATAQHGGAGITDWAPPLVLGLALYKLAESSTLAGKRLIAAAQPARFGTDAEDGDTLFLRSFDDDSMRIRAVNPHVGAFSVFNGSTVRFEELMATLLTNTSPLIAIGRPGETLPELGAVRTYVSDDEWQQAVEDSAQRVGSIVLVAGVTDGLKWELSRLRKWGLAQKVTVMLPPVDQAQAWNRLHRVLDQLGIEFDAVDQDENTGAWLGVLLRTVTAIGVDSDWRPVFYVSHRRDWLSFAATLLLSQQIVRGQEEPPEFGLLAAELGLELNSTDIGSVAPPEANQLKSAMSRFDDAARRAVDHARAEAKFDGAQQVSPEHLFLGLTRDPSSPATVLLESLGIDIDANRRAARAYLSDSGS